MTIFDIRPYSFWRNLHRASVYGWVHRGHDTPRTVLRLYLLEYLIEHQRRLIDALSQQNGPEAPRTDVPVPNTPASGVAHEIDPLQPATGEPEARVCFECGTAIDLGDDHEDDDGHYYHEWCCPVCVQRDRELYHAATA